MNEEDAPEDLPTGTRLGPFTVRAVLGRARIWLDVFDDNERARRAYEASGYRFVGTGRYPDGRALLFYDKVL